MIWHIVKKDLRLLWPLAALIGAVEWLINAVMLSRGRFDRSIIEPFGANGHLLSLVQWAGILGMAVLVTVIVQQESLPGVRADWLTRPIRRSDLLLAKLSSVIILALLPGFLGDLLEGLAYGFSFAQSASASLGKAIFLFFTLVISVFALASLTKNLMETIVGALIIQAGVPALASGLLHYSAPVDMLSRMETGWMIYTMRMGVVALGAAGIILFQYSRRKTLIGRCLLVAVVLGSQLLPGISYANALAIQQRLTPSLPGDSSVKVEFIADRSAVSERPTGPVFGQTGDVFIILPIKATGLPMPSVLYGDGTRATLILSDGEAIRLPRQMGLQVRKNFPSDAEKAVTWGIRVPMAVYRRVKDQPVRLDIEYSLTLLVLADEQRLPATGGDSRSKVLGWCGTRLDDQRSQVQFACVQPAERTNCTTIILEHKPSGTRNMNQSECLPDYSPFRWQYDADAFSRFGVTLNFGDDDNPRSDVIKASMIGESELIARAFKIQSHFTRQLVIPEITLRGWATGNN
jgi:hypothetical protein